ARGLLLHASRRIRGRGVGESHCFRGWSHVHRVHRIGGHRPPALREGALIRRFVTLGPVVGALVVVIAAGLFVADYLADPPASCATPPTTFGPPMPVPGHIEVDVHYTCEGAAQAAT